MLELPSLNKIRSMGTAIFHVFFTFIFPVTRCIEGNNYRQKTIHQTQNQYDRIFAG
jgi:hypothetical protein